MRDQSEKARLVMRGAEITAELCAIRFGQVLRRAYGHLRCADKRIARAINTDTRVAQNYLYGRHAPPAAKLIELMAECDALADEVNRMVAERRAAKGGVE